MHRYRKYDYTVTAVRWRSFCPASALQETGITYGTIALDGHVHCKPRPMLRNEALMPPQDASSRKNITSTKRVTHTSLEILPASFLRLSGGGCCTFVARLCSLVCGRSTRASTPPQTPGPPCVRGNDCIRLLRRFHVIATGRGWCCWRCHRSSCLLCRFPV